jgi:hypothetical protein
MRACLVLVLCLPLLLVGCDASQSSTAREKAAVENQQDVYLRTQPPPFFDWSLQRSLWIQYYQAANSQVSTWAVFQTQHEPRPFFMTPAQGFPIPADTQLTNPLMVAYNYSAGYIVEQPEPNGLFTSKNTDATIVMSTNRDGTLSPIYTEAKVTCFPFPVRWDPALQMLVRVEGVTPTIKLRVEKEPAKAEAPAVPPKP